MAFPFQFAIIRIECTGIGNIILGKNHIVTYLNCKANIIKKHHFNKPMHKKINLTTPVEICCDNFNGFKNCNNLINDYHFMETKAGIIGSPRSG